MVGEKMWESARNLFNIFMYLELFGLVRKGKKMK